MNRLKRGDRRGLAATVIPDDFICLAVMKIKLRVVLIDSWVETHLKLRCREGDAGIASQAGQTGTIGKTEVKLVKHAGKKEKYLHLRQWLAQTHASANSERHEVWGLHKLPVKEKP